jgi:hypothetical protein
MALGNAYDYIRKYVDKILRIMIHLILLTHQKI